MRMVLAPFRTQAIKAYLYAEGSDRIPTRPGSDRKAERQTNCRRFRYANQQGGCRRGSERKSGRLRSLRFRYTNQQGRIVKVQVGSQEGSNYLEVQIRKPIRQRLSVNPNRWDDRGIVDRLRSGARKGNDDS